MPDGLPHEVEALLALGGLAAAFPVLVASGFLIKLSSRGPVLFKQERVGKGGRTFTLYKFRTMRADGGGASVTASDDRRITRIGKLLRDTKLDELPTLLNVLKGDMSFVGPRPEVPRYVDAEDPLWAVVLKSKPGLTSPMAIQLRNEEQVMAEVDGDRERFYVETLLPYKLLSHAEYLSRRSWKSDVEIIFRTLRAVVRASEALPPSRSEIEESVRTYREKTCRTKK